MPRHRPRPSSQIRARYSTNQKKRTVPTDYALRELWHIIFLEFLEEFEIYIFYLLWTIIGSRNFAAIGREEVEEKNTQREMKIDGG